MSELPLAVDALSRGKEARGVADRTERRPGEDRVEHGLVEGGLVAEAAFEGEDVRGRDGHCCKDGGAAARGPLAEARPVVGARDPFGTGVDHGNDRGAIVCTGGEHVDPFGEDRPGRIVFHAIETKVGALGGQARQPLAELHRADFGPGVAHDLAADEELEPRPCHGLWSGKHVLDEGEMAAQRLRQVAVGGGKLDQQAEKLGDRRPGATVGDRHAQRTKPRRLQPADRFMRKDTPRLACRRTLGDAIEDRLKAGAQRLRAVCCVDRPVTFRASHAAPCYSAATRPAARRAPRSR